MKRKKINKKKERRVTEKGQLEEPTDRMEEF